MNPASDGGPRPILFLALMAALLTLSDTRSSHAQDRPQLHGVTVHLILEKSGQLSPDVTAIADFKSWNGTPLGAGLPNDDWFNDLLILVHFVSKQETFAKGRQATVTVTDATNRKVLLRRVVGDVYLDEDGKVAKPVYLAGHSCTPLAITVVGGGKTIRKTLKSECGE